MTTILPSPPEHSLTGQYLLGYHGCDRSVGLKVLSGEVKHLKPSKNDYDWLGKGIYFWIDSPTRALEWATDRRGSGRDRIKMPFVIGAVIQPGLCLNLTDVHSNEPLRLAYAAYCDASKRSGLPMAENDIRSNGKLLRRKLDCAVLNLLHQLREDDGDPAYHSVLGVFEEGGPVFSGSQIMEKTHIQMAILKPEQCIKGYFRVPGL